MFEDEIYKVFKKTWLYPSLATSINIVQEMEQVGLLKKVNYEFTQSANDENGDPLWACTVYYKNDFVNNASCTCSNGKTKLDVKKRAALTLLEEVFDEYHIQDFVTIIR